LSIKKQENEIKAKCGPGNEIDSPVKTFNRRIISVYYLDKATGEWLPVATKILKYNVCSC